MRVLRVRVLRPNVLRPHSHLFSLHQLRQERGHTWDRMRTEDQPRRLHRLCRRSADVSLSPLFITQPSASVSVLVSSSTQPRRPHRSTEAQKPALLTSFGGLLKMKISHQQRRLKRRMNSSRRRKKSRIKSRYPISLASIETKPPIRLECVRSRSRFQECHSTVESTTRLRRHQPLRASM